MFLKQYDINFHTPVFAFHDKTAVLEKLQQRGLSTKSNQPWCLLTDVRYSQVEGDVNSAKGTDLFNDAQWDEMIKTARVSDEAFFESFSEVLLKRFGISKARSC
jgi:hypothetical protein